MLKYLIIHLDDASVPFCHYNIDRFQPNLIPLDILKDGITWSMKENLTLQFIYPDYKLPEAYTAEISKTFHTDIISVNSEDEGLRNFADVIVFDSLDAIYGYPFKKDQIYVFRSSIEELIDRFGLLYPIIQIADRINIVLTDPQSFNKDLAQKYEECLDGLSNKIMEEYKSGHYLQFNLLTDRLYLKAMNNCNAGDEAITLCPDGNFYICPAFYYEKEAKFNVGNIKKGLDIKNPQLYKLNKAPICKNCDAYQCRRCVWLNQKSTLEINIPSREQCVIAHIERNASRKLLSKISEIGQFIHGTDIPEIDYLDPFEKINL